MGLEITFSIVITFLSYVQNANETLHGNGRNIFFDKPFNQIIYANAKGGVNGEVSTPVVVGFIIFKIDSLTVLPQHSWADAMVIVKLFDVVTHRVEKEFREIGRPEFYSYFGPPEDFMKDRPDLKLQNLRPPRKLKWHLDTVSLQNIELASSHFGLLTRSVDLKVLEFGHYGKEFMKR